MTLSDQRFGLYLVVTDPVTSYEAVTEAAVKAGLRYVQLRMKTADRAQIVATARRMRQLTYGTETRFIVNDDPSIAVEVEADGVHLGQGDMPIPEARRPDESYPGSGARSRGSRADCAAFAMADGCDRGD